MHGFEDVWCDTKSLGPWTIWYTPANTLLEVRQPWKGKEENDGSGKPMLI